MNYSAEIPLTLKQRVQHIVDEVLTDPAMFLVDVDVRGTKGSRVVDIFVDSDQGLDVDALAKISREISFLLETEDFIDGRYKLNVSSPGLHRPLTMVRQYKKNIGRSLKITYETETGQSVLKGELLKITDDHLEIAVSKKRTERIDIASITESKIVLPW